MSLSQLVSKLSRPNIAATAIGVTFSTIFLLGNASIATMGVLPYVTSTSRMWPVSEKLAGWKYNYDHGKKYYGASAILGALSYTAAASLSPRALKTPLWVAAACCYGVGLWTLTVMKSTNQALNYRATAVNDTYVHESEVDDLVSTWKRMNNVRIGMVTVAYGAGMTALLLAV